MIPRLKPTLGFAEFFAALRPGARDDVQNFEREFASLMGQSHALAFPYGRTGLVMLLEALGFKGQEVICPAYTCVVVPHSIVYSGNVPVFVDSEPDGFNMNLDLAEEAVTPNTAAIIATSIFGYPVNLDRLEAFKKRHPQIVVIQDCAHSFAAEWKERPVQQAGEAALFGLNISKILCSVFGGMITTNDAQLFGRLKDVRDRSLRPSGAGKSLRRALYLAAAYPTFWGPVYGLVNRMERSGFLNRFVKYFDESVIDMPCDYLESMCALEGRVGLANIARYQEVIRLRREAAEYYFHTFESRNDFMLPPKIDGATYSHFVVQVEDRKRWLKQALRRGVQLGQLIEYNIPEMSSYGGRKPDEFPVSAKYARTTINFPVWGGQRVARKVGTVVEGLV